MGCRAVGRVVGVLATVAGCGRLGFSERAVDPDGNSSGGNGDASGSAACDLTAPFGAPVTVAGLDLANADDGTFRAMPDELSGYFWSTRGGNTDIYYATRPDLASPFSVAKVAPVDSNALELDPTISPDGLTLVFRSNRGGGAGGNDLYQATRAALDQPFDAPALIAALDTAQSDVEPCFDATASELYFSSNRSGDYAIWSSSHTAGGYLGPTRIAELDSVGHDDEDPAMAPDGLTIYWRSNRPGGPGTSDIWSASRPTLAATFGPATLVPNVNSSGDDGPSWISPDGCRMYISSNRAGTNDIYVAARP